MSQIVALSQFESTASREELIIALRQARQETATLKRENEQLARLNANQRDSLAEANSELYWIQSLVANSKLNGNQVRVLYAVYQLTSQGKTRPDGLVRMFRGAIADYAGVSPRTVTSTLKTLSDSGNMKRSIAITGGGADGIEKELYLGIPQHVLQYPSNISIRDEENRGGRQTKTISICKHCQSSDIHTVCSGCGTVLQEEDIIDVLESTLVYQAQLEAQTAQDEYPLPQFETLATEGISPPDRACFHSGERQWLPAYENGRWLILCGCELCHPNLLSSKGLDLALGPAMKGS